MLIWKKTHLLIFFVNRVRTGSMCWGARRWIHPPSVITNSFSIGHLLIVRLAIAPMARIRATKSRCTIRWVMQAGTYPQTCKMTRLSQLRMRCHIARSRPHRSLRMSKCSLHQAILLRPTFLSSVPKVSSVVAVSRSKSWTWTRSCLISLCSSQTWAHQLWSIVHAQSDRSVALIFTTRRRKPNVLMKKTKNSWNVSNRCRYRHISTTATLRNKWKRCRSISGRSRAHQIA